MTRDWAGWMRLAIQEASRGTGETGPNPLVGALVVRHGRCVGKGHHVRVGEAHAEVYALADAGRKARGADLVVTLEPCNHTGRTGPCTERILQAGISRVVVGTLDPNPRERGSGVARLREAGVEVLVGVEEARCRFQNEPYFKFITTGLPFVTVKLASSLDGRLGVGGSRESVTGAAFQRYVHQMRRDQNAILVGSRTVVLDDPELSVRLARPVTHPLRVVVMGRDVPSPKSRIFSNMRTQPTLVVASTAASQGAAIRELRAEVTQRGGEWLDLAGDEEGRVDLRLLLQHLGAVCCSRVMVEGGGMLAGSLARAGLVDRIVAGVAPALVGDGGTPMFSFPSPKDMSGAIPLRLESWRRLGEDLVASYRCGPGYVSVLPEGEG